MPRLGDAYDGAADTRSRRRLYLGAALLFVGVVVAAPGLAAVTATVLGVVGVGEAPAVSLGIAVAGLAVPVVGAGLFRWVPAGRRARAAGASGVLLSSLAVAAFLVTVPPGTLTGPGSVPGVVVLTYVVGTLLALWSPIVAAGLAAGRTNRPAPRSTTAFVRSSRPARPGGQVPADGGREDEQVAFLLDRDDE